MVVSEGKLYCGGLEVGTVVGEVIQTTLSPTIVQLTDCTDAMVSEIERDNMLFLTVFSVNFIKAFATARVLYTFPEAQFSLNNDELLSWAKEKENELRTIS